MVLNLEWQKAEKKTDPDFEGSIFQELGYDAELCPTCGAHLHGGICLNTCHLSDETRQRFNVLMAVVAGKDW